MEGIILIILTLILFGWSFYTNMKMKRDIKALKSEMIDREKLISLKLEKIKNETDKLSGSILDESKSHLDAALIAMSKRIGKRKKPTEGND